MQNNSFNSEVIFASKWLLEASAPTEKPRKTPTYLLQKYLGDSPLLSRRGRGGRIYIYYKPNRSTNPEAPAINLQGIGGINYTGLRWLTSDGWRLQEKTAYGEASQKPTFDNGNANYMYPHRADAYIFVFGDFVPFDYGTAESVSKVPSVIYWLIVSDERLRAKDYCRVAALGLFKDVLDRVDELGRFV